MTKRKPPPQVLTSFRIIQTVWEQVHDPEQALKEANANRLARAKFDQLMRTDDPVVKHAMLELVEDDGTAGAALLRYAREVYQTAFEAKKRKEKLRDSNRSKTLERDINGKHYCEVADMICAKNKSLERTVYGLARATRDRLVKEGEEVSTKTIARALKRRAASLEK